MGTTGTSRARAPVPLRLGHHPQRRSFVLVLVACWTIGLFGLAGRGLSLLQLLVTGLCVSAWFAVGARRRRIELARERWLRAGLMADRPTTNVRRIER